MSVKVEELNCPGCGARVSIDQSKCEYCHKPIIISTFNSVKNMTIPEVNKYVSEYKKVLEEEPNNTKTNSGIAMCYLKLKLYEKAIEAFEKAIEDNFDNTEAYFYAAISLLKGKKAFLQSREVIDKILNYVDAAIMIEPKGIYYYFEAYIKYDFHQRKCFNVPPSYSELLNKANQMGVSELDKKNLFELLNVEKPGCL